MKLLKDGMDILKGGIMKETISDCNSERNKEKEEDHGEGGLVRLKRI